MRKPNTSYDNHTIQYTYDALSRLTEANYNSGATIHTYGYDLAGNLVNMDGMSRTYNAANQMTHDGTNSLTYDANGNLASDGVNSYTWDRANRLLSMGGVSYTYNGDGNRIQQDALNYILDLQPGLAQVIGDSDGNRYVHSPRGIHAVNEGATWQYPLTDALGSVRGYVGANNAVLSNVNYTPIGVPDTNIDGPAFTGGWRSGNETQYHQARHLSPGLGVWLSRDPWEGVTDRPMSLNGYAWVEGNLPNATDASGLCYEDAICRYLFHSHPAAYDATGCGSGERQPCYPIGPGLPTPIIRDPSVYGNCASNRVEDRPACAVQSFLAAIGQDQLGPQFTEDSMSWEALVALTIMGEASILYIAPGANNPEDLQCFYGQDPEDQAKAASDPGCGQLRRLFEQAVVRQLYEACGGACCTARNLVKYLAGQPGEFERFGIQAWYDATQPALLCDAATCRSNPNVGQIDLRSFFASNGSRYEMFFDNAIELMNNSELHAGCSGYACSWGNPAQKPPPPYFYASYRDLHGATYGVFDGRVYFTVGR